MKITSLMMRKRVFTALLVFATVHLFAQTPTISSFTPTNANVNTTMVITGSNFSTTAANNIVYFGGVSAVASAATATSLTVTIPAGANQSKITVVNLASSKSGSSSQQFVPTFPGKSTNFDRLYFQASEINGSSTPSAPASGVWSTVKSVGAVGDLNNDGKQDLVKVNAAGASVKVFQNNANMGSVSLADFATTYTFTTVTAPKDVYLADMNNDGLLDILVSNGSTTLSILINNSSAGGSISFLPKQDFTVANTTLIKVADLNQDGLPDLITSVVAGSTINIYRNTSSLPSNTLSFSSTATTLTAAGVRDMDIADLNNDGLMEIVTTSSSTNLPVNIFINASTGGTITFNSPTTLSSASTGSWSIKIADLNMDGKNDIIVGLLYEILVYQNNYSTGTFDQSSFNSGVEIPAATSSSSNYVWYLDVADIDGDGKPDIAMGDFNASSNVHLIKNTNAIGVGSTILGANFTVFKYVDALSSYGSTFLSDLDRDGKPDYVAMSSSLIAIGRSRMAEKIDFYPQYTGALSSTNRWFADPTTYSLSAADVFTNPDYILNVYNNTLTGSYTISGNLTIENHLKLYNSILSTIGYNLTINGTLSGASSTAYIQTPSPSSFLTMPVSTNVVQFPVGNSTYDMASIINNSGSADSFGINVSDVVYQNGTSGTLAYNSIQRQWVVKKTNANGGAGVDMVFNWNDTDTKNGTVTNPALYYFNGSAWVKQTTGVSIVGNSASLTGFSAPLTASTKFTIADSDVGVMAPPTISSFTPTSAAEGTTVTITGTNFAGATAVSFGGVAASSFTVVSATSITAVVANGTSGSVSVTIPAGTGTRTGFTFIAPPTTQVSNIIIKNYTTTAATINYTIGNGTGRMVFVTEGETGTATPVSGTNYSASTTFKNGTQIGTSGWYCVYKGTAATNTIGGLLAANKYRAIVFEYNGTSTNPVFNASSNTNNPLNFSDFLPTASIVMADDNLLPEETSLVTFTFDRAVTGFTTADLTVQRGTISNPTSADGGITYTATFTPTANTQNLTNVITLNNTGVTATDNNNVGFGTTTSNNYIVNTNAVLPVSLIKFTAEIQGNYAQLSWSTAKEENNKHFILNRSTNDTDFKVIGTVNAAANGMQINSYNFKDLLPAKGVNYYKLTQVDLNGTEKTLEIKDLIFGVNTIKNVNIYPNPTEDNVNISFDTNIYSSVKVINLQGQVMLQQNIVKDQERVVLSLKSFSSGIYLIKLSGKSNHIQKIIKK